MVWIQNYHQKPEITPSLSRYTVIRWALPKHYDDVIMTRMASQITSLAIVYSTVYSGADQSKHQSSASLAFVWEIHRGPVNFSHKWPVTRKMFPFDDVIMNDYSSRVLKRVSQQMNVEGWLTIKRSLYHPTVTCQTNACMPSKIMLYLQEIRACDFKLMIFGLVTFPGMINITNCNWNTVAQYMLFTGKWLLIWMDVT